MRKLFSGVCALVGGLVFCTSAFADFSDSSSDSGILDEVTPFNSTIMVSVDEIISDVQVTVNMNHEWTGDITATLSNGTDSINLLVEDTTFSAPFNLGVDDGVGGLDSAAYTFSDSGTSTIFDFGDDNSLGNNDEVPAGTYLAEGSFAIFAGSSTQGNWTLSIVDGVQDDDGGVDGWSISFTSQAAIPEPGSAALLGMLAIGLVARRRR